MGINTYKDESFAMDRRPTKVSISTITYARHPLLYLLEECILNQDYPLDLVEWVIIDDTPNAPKGFDLHRARDKGIDVRYVLLSSKATIGAKRNLANEYCSGEVIIVMDDDDYYPPSRITHAVQALVGNPGMLAGCSELPLLILPECSTWLVHPLGPGHATANTLAFKRDYLEDHSFDPEATQAEEAFFLRDFTEPMIQLEAFQTVVCIGHSRNTVDKRRFLASTHGVGVSRIYTTVDRYVPSIFVDKYSRALQDIELEHKHPVLTPVLTQSETIAANPPRDLGTKSNLRVAVITPYFQEDLAILKRCHESVKAQTLPCTHFMIADGSGYPEIEELDCRHLRLGGSGHADNGNTPRSLGALAAMNEGYNVIAYLDADNWYLPDHIESAVALHQEKGVDVVFTGREIAFPDGELLPEVDAEDISQSHVDTSSIVVFETGFRSLALWAQMPRELGPYCDRVAFGYLTSHFKCGWTSKATLVFETWYWGHFTAAGRVPPANAKYLPSRPYEEWQLVYERFRQRSHTPFIPALLPESPRKTRINLITILGPLGCGALMLQRQLCSHISFFGLPPNNFLYRWLIALGDDPSVRHDADLALRNLGELLQDPKLQSDWRISPLISPAMALTRGQAFTALEAYFRLIQATMPTRAKEYGKKKGVVNLIERSSSNSYAAEMLFTMLPMHRAILAVSSPTRQIAQRYRMMCGHDTDKLDSRRILIRLCCEYLDALLMPLEHAPEQQLLMVKRELFLAQPIQSMRLLADWLGLSTPEWSESLRRRVNTGGVVNMVYEQEMVQLRKTIESEICMETIDINGFERRSQSDLDLELEEDSALELEGSAASIPQIEVIKKLFSPLDNLLSILVESNNENDVALNPLDPLIDKSDKHNDWRSGVAIEDLNDLSPSVEYLCSLILSRLREPTKHIW